MGCLLLHKMANSQLSFQDTIVAFDDFQPKPLTSRDKEVNLCTVSQYSTQATRFNCSELLSGLATSNPTHDSGNHSLYKL